MCKFHVHVQSCDIISENDVDFGRILVPATVESDVLPSVNVDSSGIEHLDPEQQCGLLALLGEFAACFRRTSFVRSLWNMVIVYIPGVWCGGAQYDCLSRV